MGAVDKLFEEKLSGKSTKDRSTQCWNEFEKMTLLSSKASTGWPEISTICSRSFSG
ncbi:hypothetical protein RGAI101_2544 [Roseobacter sp. GAI101]|nr:hypothetical protein RGAI101_2544 [Roseobacter sp. GAI101]